MGRKVVRVSAPGIGCLGMIVLALLCLFVMLGMRWLEERAIVNTVTGTVTDKYIKRVGDVDVYHVAIQDPETGHTEVLWNRDAYTWQKLNSADVQQALKVGQTYDFTVAGIRSPLFSLFRNIVQYQPHKDSR